MYTKENLDEEVRKRLPVPSGYKLLISTLQAAEKTAGGVFVPGAARDVETTASIIGYVLDLGPSAYGDKDKFPDGPYCKVGDFVIFRSYSGTRFKIMDAEFRLINDDTVEAVVEDPRSYRRA